MSENRPNGRQRQISGTASGAEKHGSGLGTGPVGNRPGAAADQGRSSVPQGRPRTPMGTASGAAKGQSSGTGRVGSRPSSSSRPSSGGSQSFQTTHRPSSARPPFSSSASSSSGRPGSYSGGTSSSGKRGGLNPLVIIIALILLLGGGGGSMLFGGGNNNDYVPDGNVPVVQATAYRTAAPTATAVPTATARPQATKKPSASSWYQNIVHGNSDYVSTDSTQLAGTTASGLRDRYTHLLGSGQDTVTLMVYMCGTDLESRSGMASSDLQEMANATYGDNVKILIYTGGCRSWRINGISNSKNQIHRLEGKKLTTLVSDDGNASMTNPATLTRFIQYCASNYPASRYELILWDHGGGSVSGYGYDEKNASSGSMSLSGIDTALKNANVKFDFIGFDACLMATVETALMSSRYADYMIASEESEPGIGWYYTDWLTSLGKNTSMDTLTLGKAICDDFVSACSMRARGQTTTLSVVDLAQLEAQVPDALTQFARSISSLIEAKAYQTVSNARNGSREFAQSSKIDQVDLTDLALRMNNQEGKNLADVIRSCVKYNRVNGISNAYGLSIYFPYKKISSVDKAVRTYEQIGMDDAYSDCIRAFASLEASGQIAGGGQSSPYSMLTGGNYSSGYASQDLLGELLGSFLGGGSSSYSSSSSYSPYTALDFLFGKSLPDDVIRSYVFDNQFDGSRLVFAADGNDMTLSLPSEQWDLVHSIDLNVFIDDGKGYIDLGLDDVYSFNDAGDLIADLSSAWLAIDGQTMPYYHLKTEAGDQGYIRTGYVPCLLDGVRTNLYVVFEDGANGRIVGTQTDYKAGETDTDAKLGPAPEAGSVIQLLCDYYTYDGTYQDSYYFGRPITVSEDTAITDMYLQDGLNLQLMYLITDIYNQSWWTKPIPMHT